ncbi:Lrp/AsnC family transcriptional regulator [Abyssibius alkaniclasticus]|uniref:Lrp/AsnC family transcriptional regulator n=1 Tax=Abyssibius alkaniclasticus TaxID=2881234 RepID=UPI0023643138|nr:Lrp/AsnC family transcriptional regulator [Abyssibius alkaniclasticus]UPH71657.1 Lrp/AsnC family transcriptional regulator [Abyssibius alkaniclasticus]|tara:strand:- start:192 stop:647 length:456 start_codon:yes stop_codon:yes gene_type:complete
MPVTLDPFDHAILVALSTNARMSITDLAREIGLTKTPTQARLKRLEADGVILGYRAQLNAAALGLDHIAFVQVRLSDTRDTALKAFNAAVAKVAEIEQCHMIAANFDYLLKVRTRDIDAYRRVMGEKISTLPNVVSTSTFVAMESVKEDSL